MIAQSGFDIKVIVNELKELEKGRIEKFYNTPDGELIIKLYKAKFGKVNIRVLRGECIHLTNFTRNYSEQPSNFTMLMRKYMSGSSIVSIEQPFFERVIIFKIRRAEEEFNIIIELFNKGNIVICDKNLKIINSLKFVREKERLIRNGEDYKLPQPRFQELYLDKIEFKRTIKSSDKESVVKSLAIDFGLGGKYAEELCALCGIDKAKNPTLLKDDEVKKVFDVFFLLYQSIKHYKNIRPCIATRNEEIVNFFPFPFKSFEDCEFKFFDTYNEACDYFYSHTQKQEYETNAEVVVENRINQLQERADKQRENLEYLKEESERLAKLGEIVFSNYDLINNVLSKLLEANKNNIGWDEIKRMVESEKSNGSPEASIIKEINEEQGIITLFIDNEEFDVALRSNSTDIAQNFFEKSKKMKNKISGAEESVEVTTSKIEDVQNEEIVIDNEIVEKKKDDKKWFEKYRWMRTSNDFLFVSGKDATQNEIVVKKVAEDKDLIFHTSLAGSPFGVLKNGVEASQEDKEECAQFIAAYSRAWREKIPADVFCVKREQVSKTAPSGEYIGHGSFIIKGEKEFFNGIWPMITIGVNEEGKVIAGPNELIKKSCEKFVNLKNGFISPGKVSRRLMSIFDEHNFTSEDFLQFIPGDSMIEY